MKRGKGVTEWRRKIMKALGDNEKETWCGEQRWGNDMCVWHSFVLILIVVLISPLLLLFSHCISLASSQTHWLSVIWNGHIYCLRRR